MLIKNTLITKSNITFSEESSMCLYIYFVTQNLIKAFASMFLNDLQWYKIIRHLTRHGQF